MRKKPIPWNSFPEGQLVLHDKLWVVRTGVVVNAPTPAQKYKDRFVELTQMKGSSSTAILGYTLSVKKRKSFNLFQAETFLSLLSDVEEHSKPEYVYEDPKVHLVRFNKKSTPSYWLLVRYRP